MHIGSDAGLPARHSVSEIRGQPAFDLFDGHSFSLCIGDRDYPVAVHHSVIPDNVAVLCIGEMKSKRARWNRKGARSKAASGIR